MQRAVGHEDEQPVGHSGDCRRKALAVIAAGSTPAAAASQIADVLSPHLPAVEGHQKSNATAQGASQPAADAGTPAASVDLPPADMAVQQQLQTPQQAQNDFSVQPPQHAQGSQAAASAQSTGEALVQQAETTSSAPPPVWMPQAAAVPAPVQVPGKRGFWGTVGAYITGADKRQTT
jgi:hypothetical protein